MTEKDPHHHHLHNGVVLSHRHGYAHPHTVELVVYYFDLEWGEEDCSPNFADGLMPCDECPTAPTL